MLSITENSLHEPLLRCQKWLIFTCHLGWVLFYGDSTSEYLRILIYIWNSKIYIYWQLKYLRNIKYIRKDLHLYQSRVKFTYMWKRNTFSHCLFLNLFLTLCFLFWRVCHTNDTQDLFHQLQIGFDYLIWHMVWHNRRSDKLSVR